MDNKNIEQFKKLANVFNVKNFISPKEIEQVLVGIVEIMSSFKKDNEKLTAETKQVVEILFERVIAEHEKLSKQASDTFEQANSNLLSKVETAIGLKEKKIDAKIKQAENLIAEIKAIEVKDGKDADEDRIIAEIIAQLKTDPSIEETGETIVGKINLLDTSEENQIDASHIKNLPIPKGGYAPTVLGNAVDLNQSARADGYAIVWDDTAKNFKFAPGGGGGGGAFSSITGTPTEVAYFDSLGNGTSNSAFWVDESKGFDLFVYDIFPPVITYGLVSFTGTGTNDLTYAGTFTGADTGLVSTLYTVTMGKSDAFTWTSDQGGSGGSTAPVTGFTLDNGITIDLPSTGYNETDVWTFQINVKIQEVGSVNTKTLKLISTGDSGVIRITSPENANYRLTLPPAQGASGETLINDGSGNMSWGSAGGSPVFLLDSTTPGDDTIYSSVSNYTPGRAIDSFFAGVDTGNIVNADTATNANWIGNIAGTGAGNSSSNNLIGTNFFGAGAGSYSDQADNSNFLGTSAGAYSNGSFNNFLGANAGENSIGFGNNYIGGSVGKDAIGNYNNFLGSNTGNDATGAENSFFAQRDAGAFSVDAAYSIFIGENAGKSTVNGARNSIFLGQYSGQSDTVNNLANPDDFSILIGGSTSTGGFSNSIAIGGGATNTATNQLMLGSSTRPINEITLNGNSDDNIITYTKKITSIPSAVNAMNTTPIPTGITAPSGYAVQILDVYGGVTYNTTPYATNTGVNIAFSTTPTQSVWQNANIIGGTTSEIRRFSKTTGSGAEVVIPNDELVITNIVGDPTAGDSDLNVYITYKIITL